MFWTIMGTGVAAVIAIGAGLQIWSRRNPLAPEEEAALDSEMRYW